MGRRQLEGLEHQNCHQRAGRKAVPRKLSRQRLPSFEVLTSMQGPGLSSMGVCLKQATTGGSNAWMPSVRYITLGINVNIR